MGLHLTASRLHHTALCAYPYRADVPPPPAEPPGVATLTGTAFASLRAHHIDPSRPVDIPGGADGARARQLFEVWRAWWTSMNERCRYPLEGHRAVASERTGRVWRTEVPLAWDAASGAGRILPQPAGAHRDYGAARATEIVGTADLLTVSVDANDAAHVTVLDDKTGRPEYVEPVEENWQLRALALAAARAFKATTATIGLVFVSDDGVTMTTADLDELELDIIEADLQALYARIPGAPPTPGDTQCRFCPCRATCPAFAEAAAALVPADGGAELATLLAAADGALSVERIAAAWPRLRLVEAGVERIKNAIRAHVAAHGAVPLGPGRVLRLSTTTRSTLSSEVTSLREEKAR